MNKLSVVLLLALATIAGCRNDSERGGPGAVSDERTFTLSVPGTTTTVEQGKREEVTLSIDRGDAFRQTVKLQFKTPAGVNIIPPDPAIKTGESSTKVFVDAGAAAALGEHAITVTAVPETGKLVSANMPVKVTERQ